jgi:uncharacterized protein
MKVLKRPLQFWKSLTRPHDDRFLLLLRSHVSSAVQAASLGRAVTLGEVDPRTATNRLIPIAERGTQDHETLVRTLARALSTPLDPEDIFRLSRSLGEVRENLADFVREFALFAPGSDQRCARLLEPILSSLTLLDTCLSQRRVVTMRDEALFARQHVTQVREQYQLALAELYSQPLASDVLRRRELLRRLDVVGLRLAEATDVLSDATIKRA